MKEGPSFHSKIFKGILLGIELARQSLRPFKFGETLIE
jgi:hypothetical protein